MPLQPFFDCPAESVIEFKLYHSCDTSPQETVSSVVMEDERRILKSLRDIKDLLDHFNPSLTTKFSIKSLLTLVVENTFSEMRSGATDMPLLIWLMTASTHFLSKE